MLEGRSPELNSVGVAFHAGHRGERRLVREHWNLAFNDPGQATERVFRSGDDPDRATSG
ncbi:hypothetical protein [Streptomyces mirabilis]|uniref:hypothetical protein n=1 Tax=Streptomyces mirabilis TaxID=68239 RepID=UPI003682BA21